MADTEAEQEQRDFNHDGVSEVHSRSDYLLKAGAVFRGYYVPFNELAYDDDYTFMDNQLRDDQKRDRNKKPHVNIRIQQERNGNSPEGLTIEHRQY